MSAFDKCFKDSLAYAKPKVEESTLCPDTNASRLLNICNEIDNNILRILDRDFCGNVSDKKDVLFLLWDMRNRYTKEIKILFEDEIVGGKHEADETAKSRD